MEALIMSKLNADTFREIVKSALKERGYKKDIQDKEIQGVVEIQTSKELAYWTVLGTGEQIVYTELNSSNFSSKFKWMLVYPFRVQNKSIAYRMFRSDDLSLCFAVQKWENNPLGKKVLDLAYKQHLALHPTGKVLFMAQDGLSETDPLKQLVDENFARYLPTVCSYLYTEEDEDEDEE